MARLGETSYKTKRPDVCAPGRFPSSASCGVAPGGLPVIAVCMAVALAGLPCVRKDYTSDGRQ